MNMLRKSSLAALVLLPFLCGALVLSEPSAGVESADVKALFKNPPREYSTGPLWVWNDLLTERQVRETLRDLAGQKVKLGLGPPAPRADDALSV